VFNLVFSVKILWQKKCYLLILLCSVLSGCVQNSFEGSTHSTGYGGRQRATSSAVIVDSSTGAHPYEGVAVDRVVNNSMDRKNSRKGRVAIKSF
jgi:hypothetical protein